MYLNTGPGVISVFLSQEPGGTTSGHNPEPKLAAEGTLFPLDTDLINHVDAVTARQ